MPCEPLQSIDERTRETSQLPFASLASCVLKGTVTPPESSTTSKSVETISDVNAAAQLLPEVLAVIVRLLESDVQDVRAFRLTCKAWRVAADASVQELQLRAPRVQSLISRFPALDALDLQACSHVRNSHLETIAHNALGGRLTTLRLGNMAVPQAGKIKLSNQALTSIARMTALQSLSLCNCWAITDTGMDVLSTLTALSSLTVLDCPRLSDVGMRFLTNLPQLESLAVSGMKVTDTTLLSLPTLPHLSRLHLCSVGSSPSGLALVLAGLRDRLTELVLTWMALSQEALLLLASMQNLNALKLLECRGCPCSDMLSVAATLRSLKTCHLHNVEGILGGAIGERVKQLVLATPALEDLSFIGIYGPAMRPVLQELATLKELQRLGLGAPTGRWASQLSELSLLTGLTALQVKCAHFSYSGQWSGALACLPKLRHLDLSHNYLPTPAFNPLLPPSWSIVHDQLVAHVGRCKSLTKIDLSFTTITLEQLKHVVAMLPGLKELVMYGVPLSAEDVAKVQACKPALRLLM